MNKISVVILNFNRPSYIKKDILPNLEKISFIDEVIISHGKKDTFFQDSKFKNINVKHLEHWEKDNATYGLTLRFYSALEAKNSKIIIMDDDIIPSLEAVEFLNEKISEDSNRLYGLYGRNLDKYNNYEITNYFGEVPIVLTRCLITTKEMCIYFMDNFRTYENKLIENSKPYWNGEDILFSLLSIKKYGKLPKVYNLKHSNRALNYLNLNDSINLGDDNDHVEYRKKLTKDFIDKLGLNNKIKKETKIKTYRSQFTYFFVNSVLLFIFYLFVMFVFVFDVYYFIYRG